MGAGMVRGTGVAAVVGVVVHVCAVAGARGYGDNDFKIGLAQRTLAAVLSTATRTA